MNVNIKLIILSVLIGLIFILTVLSNISTKDLESSKSELDKLSNKLHIIKSITNYYDKPDKNKRKLSRILSNYSEQIIFKKEEKSTIEFKVSNINSNKLNILIKDIVNGGFKVLNFKVTRLTDKNAELHLKVLF